MFIGSIACVTTAGHSVSSEGVSGGLICNCLLEITDELEDVLRMLPSAFGSVNELVVVFLGESIRCDKLERDPLAFNESSFSVKDASSAWNLKLEGLDWFSELSCGVATTGDFSAV